MNEQTLPFVTIVVPVLNEERYIGACLASLLAQGADWADGTSFELLVMDGGSTDRTEAIVAALRQEHPGLAFVRNPSRLQSAALNLAARLASPRATVLLRADAHALYPPDFLATCVGALLAAGSSSVVVPMLTVGETGFQRAVAAAQNSRLGNGGSAHRRMGSSGFVEHGHHAVYDETFTHNEDAEYDHRVGLAGGRIWMCGEIALKYFPRRDPWRLAKQYFNHGAGRARTLLAHRIRPRLRQMLPLAILIGCIGSLLLSPVHAAFLLIPVLYCLTGLAFGVIEAIRGGDAWLVAMGPAAMIMHLSWATGFLSKCIALIGKSTKRLNVGNVSFPKMQQSVEDGTTPV